jgi:hypothetical protein
MYPPSLTSLHGENFEALQYYGGPRIAVLAYEARHMNRRGVLINHRLLSHRAKPALEPAYDTSRGEGGGEPK